MYKELTALRKSNDQTIRELNELRSEMDNLKKENEQLKNEDKSKKEQLEVVTGKVAESIKEEDLIEIKNQWKVERENQEIILWSLIRGGSTFVGRLLSLVPTSFYYEEPLHFLPGPLAEFYYTFRNEDDLARKRRMLKDIHLCHVKEYNSLVNSMDLEHDGFGLYNNALASVCERYILCNNTDLIEALCQGSDAVVSKVNHLGLRGARGLLEDPELQSLKIVHMRIRVFAPSGQFVSFRFEDFVLEPKKSAKKMLRFLDVPYTQQIASYLGKTNLISTSETVARPYVPGQEDEDKYSVVRNSRSVAFKWRGSLSFEQMSLIQDPCVDVLRGFGYTVFHSKDQYSNVSIRPMLEYPFYGENWKD
ncbi:carbohydrate sulfotransferase 1-like [Oratosquilla oratoria]|uniref:carbohydrate sulfotransferase 1-like n=1 Tax=Oratosquilla oratoria TaxID=337810 RepID=UPI003F75B0F8